MAKKKLKKKVPVKKQEENKEYPDNTKYFAKGKSVNKAKLASALMKKLG